ncbi:hypothetical protein [uncultured Xylophilus sp.]|uniref:hypothetical protein n=1 Tax=uncultured Xylophilus sp. TaxID=296832 RepID=UPI0025D23CD7|nr:hypothetical protein [uncultured Xylophilus sp.]
MRTSPTPSMAPRLACAAACVLGLAAAVAPAAAADRTTTIERPGSGQNRIEVTGNTARGVTARCADGSTRRGANINSVDVDARALQGRTEIVTGRNVQGVDAAVDCSPNAAGRPQGGANVNSVTIR